ncbi:MAG TPA: ComF family protein [Candidatus Omnitrophota bacterium]|nr:ComF family protein [Candidatus Omnitrophota bacterium]
MQFIKTLSDLIFPPRCQVCRGVGPRSLCPDCESKVNYLSPSAFVHSVTVYDDVVKKAIHRFKFKKKLELSEPLGRMMVKYLSRHLNMSGIDLIVPVPLHRNRFTQRGFNQAEVLSHELTRHYGVPTVSGMLFRVKETAPQFDLPRAERFKNVRGAFEVKGKGMLKDRNVLLVDDIYTTGSTVSECTRVLKDGGARNVHVLTLSRVL